MPLPLTVSCFSKIQIGFTFLIPAYPGSRGQRAIKRVCACVCVRACVRVCVRACVRACMRACVITCQFQGVQRILRYDHVPSVFQVSPIDFELIVLLAALPC